MEEEYFLWLYEYVAPDGEYLKLFNDLYDVPYKWSVPNDDNRAADGIALRFNYIYNHEVGCEFPESFKEKPCTFLEMLVALALRISTDISDRSPDFWFNAMLVNSGLKKFDDIHYDKILVLGIIDTILNRTYKKDGRGGLFFVNDLKSVKPPTDDFRTVELWYQMSFWYMENFAEEMDVYE